MHAPLESPALWGIILNIVLQWVNANLCLGFKVTKHQEESTKGTAKSISVCNDTEQYVKKCVSEDNFINESFCTIKVNCQVGNITYAHGEIFKLDCKTQCVCENGRHACSSLCPKEQLPAPEDTLSCRSPRLVEVPGHCCKMWLCENPTADVYATCHNSTESPWTPCSNVCGLGISTRFTSTAYGCSQLSNVRLCNNRKCTTTDGSRGDFSPNNNNHISSEFKIWQHLNRNNVQRNRNYLKKQHRIRKGHECRSIQRLGPSHVRLGECVSRKVYRPKLCGRCHDKRKCCVPSASTTIQVELLCPLNAIDPISYIQQHQQNNTRQFSSATTSMTSSPSLWDAHTHEPINQEFLQSHQTQMKSKFIAVEWILKCACRKNKHCLKNFGSNNTNTELITNLKKANINSKYKRYDASELNNEQNYDNASNDIEPQIVSNKEHLNEFNRRISTSDDFQSYHIQNPLLFTLRIPQKHYELKKSYNDVDEMAMSRKTSQPLKIKHNVDKKIYYRLPPHEVEVPRKQQHYYHKHHPQKP